MAHIIVIAGTGSKAFCAGGDVAILAEQNASGPEGQALSQAYFGLEYQLDHLIATYPKPYVAYMDGITMGGGAGLSIHAPFRIATERTRFAMPETRIGFFPDVGASFFLPRLEGFIGTYLALTSAELEGVNALYAGIATHYIHSSMLPNLTARLGELEFKDHNTLEEKLAIVDATIEDFCVGLPHNKPMLISGDMRLAIDRCFNHSKLEQILEALELEREGPVPEWAEQTLKTLSERSPTSLKVALRLMRIGTRWSITETFQREYHIAGRFMAHPDFSSGVSARLIHKPPTTPNWEPPMLTQVSTNDVDQFFIVEGQKRLQIFGEDAQWLDYPSRFGLPGDSDVKAVFEVVDETEREKDRAGKWTDSEARARTRDLEIGLTNRHITERSIREKVIREMIKRTAGKQGVREKVEEILIRCCSVGNDGFLNWIN